MIPYLIKSACCAVVFLTVYRLFLEKEKMHRFNRAYLLLSVVLSLVVPLIVIPVATSLPSADLALPAILSEEVLDTETPHVMLSADASEAPAIPLKTLLILLYTIVTAILLVRSGMNLYRLSSVDTGEQIFFHEGTRVVIIQENISSYTFLNTIFISRRDYADDTAILRHELAHVRQKHSLDILFIELMKVIFWCNPIYIFYKRSIQLNHEFLADEAVVQHGVNVPAYQYLLLERASVAGSLPLTSCFNYSVTKKRLQMITQQTNPARAMLKKMALLPLAIISMIVFGTRSVLSAGSVLQPGPITEQDTAKKKEKDLPMVEFVKPLNVPFTKEGISEKDYGEYISIQKKYLDPEKSSKENGKIFRLMTEEDKKRLQSLFIKMTREQQYSVTIRFMKTPGPFTKILPSGEQYEKWKNPDFYGIWINAKKVSNSELDKYTASDFSHYFSSRLYGAAKKNVRYQVQVNLMTNRFYEDYYQKSLQAVNDNPYHMIVAWSRMTGIPGRAKIPQPSL